MTRKRARALLHSLANALCDGTTLAWVVANAADRDPLPAAWAQCRDASEMSWLLTVLEGRGVFGWRRPHTTRLGRPRWRPPHRRPMSGISPGVYDGDFWFFDWSSSKPRSSACARLRRYRPTLTRADVVVEARHACSPFGTPVLVGEPLHFMRGRRRTSRAWLRAMRGDRATRRAAEAACLAHRWAALANCARSAA